MSFSVFYPLLSPGCLQSDVKYLLIQVAPLNPPRSDIIFQSSNRFGRLSSPRVRFTAMMIVLTYNQENRIGLEYFFRSSRSQVLVLAPAGEGKEEIVGSNISSRKFLTIRKWEVLIFKNLLWRCFQNLRDCEILRKNYICDRVLKVEKKL